MTLPPSSNAGYSNGSQCHKILMVSLRCPQCPCPLTTFSLFQHVVFLLPFLQSCPIYPSAEPTCGGSYTWSRQINDNTSSFLILQLLHPLTPLSMSRSYDCHKPAISQPWDCHEPSKSKEKTKQSMILAQMLKPELQIAHILFLCLLKLWSAHFSNNSWLLSGLVVLRWSKQACIVGWWGCRLKI